MPSSFTCGRTLDSTYSRPNHRSAAHDMLLVNNCCALSVQLLTSGMHVARSHTEITATSLPCASFSCTPHAHPAPPPNTPHTLDTVVPRWHFDMVLDSERNSAYDAAITGAVRRKRAAGCTDILALDVGAGTGLLSMMAAR